MRLTTLLEPLRGLDLEKVLHLRPHYPSAALEVDRREMVLVRLRRRGRGRPELEAAEARGLTLHPADAPPEMEPTGAYPSPSPPPAPTDPPAAAAEARMVTSDDPDECRDMPVSGGKPEA